MKTASSTVLFTALAVAGLASPALASETAVNINATVGGFCQMGPGDAGGADPSAPITLDVGTDAVHAGVVEASAATTRALRLTCNQPFVVHLASEQGAVRRMSSANGGSGVDTPILGGTMAKAIAYTASPRLVNLDTANFVPTYVPLVADQQLRSGVAPADGAGALNVVRTSAAGENSGGAYDGTLEIAITTSPSQSLVSGFYRDTLTVVLLAQ